MLGRRFTLVDDAQTPGRLELGHADRVVRLILPPRDLEEYCRDLDDQIPGLPEAPPDRRDLVRARYIAIWLSELVESDLSGSVRSIRLARNRQHRLFLDAVREPGVRPGPPRAGAGGYWSTLPGPD